MRLLVLNINYIGHIIYKYKALSALLIGLYQRYQRTCPFGHFRIISRNNVECETTERCCSGGCMHGPALPGF